MFFFYLGYDLLVVKATLVLLPENDVGRRLVQPDAESVELLLDDLLVRHALAGGGTRENTAAVNKTKQKEKRTTRGRKPIFEQRGQD